MRASEPNVMAPVQTLAPVRAEIAPMPKMPSPLIVTAFATVTATWKLRRLPGLHCDRTGTQGVTVVDLQVATSDRHGAGEPELSWLRPRIPLPLLVSAPDPEKAPVQTRPPPPAMLNACAPVSVTSREQVAMPDT